jgi:eukaryotic-like serine/threonine-protein kinase
VLIGADDRTVLTDFGIATFQNDPSLTQSGMVVGTPGFTAPERVRGGCASPASDLWSLGATLFAAVEGRGPFDRPGGVAAITAGVISEDAPQAPSAGPLAEVIGALLRADPDQRPDAAAAARLLADAAAEAESSAAYLSPPRHGSPQGPASAPAPRDLHDPLRPVASLDLHPPADLDVPADIHALADCDAPAGPHVPAEPHRPGSLPAFTDLPDPPWLRPDAARAWPAGDGAPVRTAARAAPPPPGTPGELRPAQHAGTGREHPQRPRGGRRARIAVLAAVAVGIAAAGLIAWEVHSRSVTAAAAASSAASHGGSASMQQVTGDAAAPGYQRYEVTAASGGGVAGFEVAAPATWVATRLGLATYLRPPTGNAYIEISLAPYTYPRPAREAVFLQAEALQRSQYPGYRLIAIEARTFRGVPDAVWRFRWYEPGVGRVDVLELLMAVNTRAGTQPYVLTLSAPSPGFPLAEPVFLRALESFRPLP